MPIPATRSSVTTYNDVGLGDLVEQVTRGRIERDHLCHHDPMFVDGECVFGQCDAAQSHLANQGVGVGDIFLFFGLFADEGSYERHHRFFGYMRVAEKHCVNEMEKTIREEFEHLRHPHVFGLRSPNNTIYRGEGATAAHAHEALRLTRTAGPLSRWTVPPWLGRMGLSYHSKPTRWIGETELDAVARGQEFVCDIGDDPVANEWVENVMEFIRS